MQSWTHHQTQKTAKAIGLFEDMLKYLNSSKVEESFKLVLVKTLRQLVAQLNFRDPVAFSHSPDLQLLWQKAIKKVY